MSIQHLLDGTVTSHLFVVCPPLTEGAALREVSDRIRAVDLRARYLAAREPVPITAGSTKDAMTPVCAFDLEYGLRDGEWNRKVLSWLEAGLDAPGIIVVVVSSRDPEPAAFLPADPAGDEPTASRPDLERRWRAVLARFVKVHAEDTGDPAAFEGELKEWLERRESAGEASEETERLAQAVRAECWEKPQLEAVGRKVLALPRSHRLEPDEVVEQIREAAEGYYWALWATLSRAEKLLVARLAEGNMVNWKASAAVRRLTRSRIVLTEPYFRLMNESFAVFVRRIADSEALAKAEAQGRVSVWQQVQAPLYIGVLGVAGFLFVTQRELFHSTLAFISAAAASLPIAFRLLDQARAFQARAGVE